jgi:AraC-like DNA-binding protein
LRETILNLARKKEYPVLYTEKKKVYFGAVYLKEEEFLLLGPIMIEDLDILEFHKYCKRFGLDGAEDCKPRKLGISRFLAFLSLLFYRFRGMEMDPDQILKYNFSEQEEAEVKKEKQTETMLKNIVEDLHHHSYQEEVHFLNAVATGDVSKVKQLYEGGFLETVGKLSTNTMNHYKYTAVSVISLTTRIAIDAGISPDEAYALSDSYINQLDGIGDEAKVLSMIRTASINFAKRVREIQNTTFGSSYVEQCKSYITKNYHHKFTLEEMAESIGINQTYLSHLFSEQEHMSFTEYVNRYRIDRAKNLLKYSHSSLSEIADYLCFSSQSHFGKVFKKYEGITPQKYRTKYKPREFIEKKEIE